MLAFFRLVVHLPVLMGACVKRPSPSASILSNAVSELPSADVAFVLAELALSGRELRDAQSQLVTFLFQPSGVTYVRHDPVEPGEYLLHPKPKPETMNTTLKRKISQKVVRIFMPPKRRILSTSTRCARARVCLLLFQVLQHCAPRAGSALRTNRVSPKLDLDTSGNHTAACWRWLVS